jgi:hypothetical protein
MFDKQKKTTTKNQASTIDEVLLYDLKQKVIDERIEKMRDKLNGMYYCVKIKEDKLQEIRLQGFSNKSKEKAPEHIILPLSTKKIMWDLFQALIIIGQTFFIPLDISFNKECFLNDTGTEIIKYLNIFTYIFFGIDIIITFFTALQNEKGEYEYSLRKIAFAYFSFHFIFDIGAIVPFEYIISFNQGDCWTASVSTNKIMLFLRFLKLMKLFRINGLLEKMTPAKFVNVVRIFKVIIFYFFFTHFIGMFFTGNSITLLTKMKPALLKESGDINKISKTWENFFSFYTYSLFVGIYIVLGNDTIWTQQVEKILIILINVLSLIVNANVFGYIAVTLKNASLGGEETNNDAMDSINEFLNYRENITTKLKNEINSYYLLMYKRQRNLFNRDDMFEGLNDCLKVLMKFEYWKTIYFGYDKLFSMDNISTEFCCDCIINMHARMYIWNERILQEGEVSTDIYFIPGGGKCAVSIHGNYIKILKEGEYFGETAVFLKSEKRTTTVESLNMSDMLYIPGEDFIRILRNHPEEAEYFKNIAKVNFYKSIGMTRINLVNQLFSKDESDSVFKSNLYGEKKCNDIAKIQQENPLTQQQLHKQKQQAIRKPKADATLSNLEYDLELILNKERLANINNVDGGNNNFYNIDRNSKMDNLVKNLSNKVQEDY